MARRKKPQWRRWRDLSDVCIWEAVALSLNVDPRTVRWGAGLIQYTGHGELDEGPEFMDRMHVLERNVESGQILQATTVDEKLPYKSTISLPIFANWATSVGWRVPKELAAIGESPSLPASQKTGGRGGEQPLSTKERNTALKLIVTMAMEGYKFNPADSRSRITSEIVSDLEKHGFSLDPDTVREWLKKASELLDQKKK